MKNKDTFFIYDKNNSLTTLVETRGDRIHSYYNLEGRRLTKKNTNTYDDGIEEKMTITDYEEDVVLQHLFIMGESCVNATLPGSNHVGRVPVADRVISGNGNLESFKIKPNLVNNWVSILNMSRANA